MGPVINKSSMKSILDYIETGKKEGRLVAGGSALEGDGGYFIAPTVIADVAPDARIAQEEIFGPVLAVIKARDFEQALEIANGTRVWPDRRGVYAGSEEARKGLRGIPRGELVLEPQVHRSAGGRASVRRVQHVGNGFESGRARLPAALSAGENSGGKARRHAVASRISVGGAAWGARRH